MYIQTKDSVFDMELELLALWNAQHTSMASGIVAKLLDISMIICAAAFRF